MFEKIVVSRFAAHKLKSSDLLIGNRIRFLISIYAIYLGPENFELKNLS